MDNRFRAEKTTPTPVTKDSLVSRSFYQAWFFEWLRLDSQPSADEDFHRCKQTPNYMKTPSG